MSRQRSGLIGFLIIGLLTVGFAVFIGDLLFSAPDHQIGTIVEKIFVAAHSETGRAAYSGIRRSNYSVTVAKEDQWIALVKLENGDTLKVHCLPGHYKTKNVGDAIHFKKYEGKLLHIDYFAHNEEEEDAKE